MKKFIIFLALLVNLMPHINHEGSLTFTGTLYGQENTADEENDSTEVEIDADTTYVDTDDDGQIDAEIITYNYDVYNYINAEIGYITTPGQMVVTNPVTNVSPINPIQCNSLPTSTPLAPNISMNIVNNPSNPPPIPQSNANYNNYWTIIDVYNTITSRPNPNWEEFTTSLETTTSTWTNTAVVLGSLPDGQGAIFIANNVNGSWSWNSAIVLPKPKDCAGVEGGAAYKDSCGNCVGGTTGNLPCIKDCAGVWGGTAYKDNCNQCVGGTSGKQPCIKDCAGTWGGTAYLDSCNQCVGGTSGKQPCKNCPITCANAPHCTFPSCGKILDSIPGCDCGRICPKHPCETSIDSLKIAFPDADSAKLRKLKNLLDLYAFNYGINSKEKLQHFLAQAGHETGGLKKLGSVENLYYKDTARLIKVFPSKFSHTDTITKRKPDDYVKNEQKLANYVYAGAKPLGNGDEASGDGYKYRGRGIFQLTGKDNYTRFKNFYNNKYDPDLDLNTNPDLVSSNDTIAVLSALWFYKTQVLDKITVNDKTTVDAVTQKINSKKEGLPDRKKKYKLTKKHIDCDNY